MANPGDAPAVQVATTPAIQTSGPDWPTQVADTIESVVGGVAGKTAVPATTIVRGLVYGVVIGVMASVALVLVAVAADRLLVIAYAEVGAGVWAAHGTLGAIFLLGGLLLWRMRRPKDNK